MSAGALIALEELGLTGVFDEVYGCSAGAVNGAYFLAGQAAFGTAIYYQDVNNRHFINPWRFWRIADVDYVFDTVVRHVKPLDVAEVLDGPTPLFAVVADTDTGASVLIHVQKSPTPLLAVLKASSALPVLYNRLIDVEGRPCCDGGFVNPIPLEEAIASGCTDILVLLTRPRSYVELAPNWLHRAIFGAASRRRSVAFQDAYLAVHERANAARDLALGRRPPPGGINIATVCPQDNDTLVERTTRTTHILKRAASESIARMYAALGQPTPQVVEVQRPFPRR